MSETTFAKRLKDIRPAPLIGRSLTTWLNSYPQSGRDVIVGERRVRVSADCEIDVQSSVLYFENNCVRIDPFDDNTMTGRPVLITKILAPFETYGELTKQIFASLDCGVKVVWIVEPKYQTVTVYRPDRKPELFNKSQTISAEPHLSGYRAPVADFFLW